MTKETDERSLEDLWRAADARGISACKQIAVTIKATGEKRLLDVMKTRAELLADLKEES